MLRHLAPRLPRLQLPSLKCTLRKVSSAATLSGEQPLRPGVVQHVLALVAQHKELSEKMQSEGYSTERAKELVRLSPIVEAHAELEASQREVDGICELLGDPDTEPELKELAREELTEGERLLVERRKRLVSVLVPPDEASGQDGAILEVHAGVGGAEAALFADEVLEMYRRLAKRSGWKFDLLNRSSPGGIDGGGCRDATVSLNGHEVYSKLRSESGVHRVQRIPKTETMGRVHTSTAVVVVLPEAEEADVEVSEVRGRERDPGASHLGLGLCAGRPLGSRAPRRPRPSPQPPPPIPTPPLAGRRGGGDVPRERGGRAAREHDGQRGAADSRAHGHQGLVPERALAAHEQGDGDARIAHARAGHARAEGQVGDEQRAGRADGHRRPLREDPHVQLPQ